MRSPHMPYISVNNKSFAVQWTIKNFNKFRRFGLLYNVFRPEVVKFDLYAYYENKHISSHHIGLELTLQSSQMLVGQVSAWIKGLYSCIIINEKNGNLLKWNIYQSLWKLLQLSSMMNVTQISELNSEFKLSEVFIHFLPANSVSPQLYMRFYHNISSILWHSVL